MSTQVPFAAFAAALYRGILLKDANEGKGNEERLRMQQSTQGDWGGNG
jgi:hypothetical protein